MFVTLIVFQLLMFELKVVQFVNICIADVFVNIVGASIAVNSPANSWNWYPPLDNGTWSNWVIFKLDALFKLKFALLLKVDNPSFVVPLSVNPVQLIVTVVIVVPVDTTWNKFVNDLSVFIIGLYNGITGNSKLFIVYIKLPILIRSHIELSYFLVQLLM